MTYYQGMLRTDQPINTWVSPVIKGIKSSKNLGYNLREENRLLANKILKECQKEEEFTKAVNSKRANFVAESSFMVLILQLFLLFLLFFTFFLIHIFLHYSLHDYANV
jgi:hypothetical protein